MSNLCYNPREVKRFRKSSEFRRSFDEKAPSFGEKSNHQNNKFWRNSDGKAPNFDECKSRNHFMEIERNSKDFLNQSTLDRLAKFWQKCSEFQQMLFFIFFSAKFWRIKLRESSEFRRMQVQKPFHGNRKNFERFL